MRFLLLLTLALAVAVAAASVVAPMSSATALSFNKGVVNSNVKRTINVKSHVEAVSTAIEVKNNGDDSTSFYLVAIAADKREHLSYITAADNLGALVVEEIGASVAIAGLPSYGDAKKPAIFRVALRAPLEKKQTLALTLETVFTHTLTPLPAKIKQDEDQLVQYFDNHYFFSPYANQEEEHSVRIASERIEARSKKPKPTKVKRNKIELGPYTDTSPFSFAELMVHYENNSPFVTFRDLVKEIEVSHWGNVAFNEQYLLQNTGAALDGSFSRSDYVRARGASAKSSFRTIRAVLPPRAGDIYYRDSIGNISTSHVRSLGRNEGTLIEVDPRFPMLGGWKTDFYVSYNVPARQHLRRDASDPETFVLNVTFSSSFEECVGDSALVRIVLPEGAENIRYRAPFALESAEMGLHFTMLDTTGRPVVILKKSNLVEWHNQHVQIVYSFPQRHLFYEPLLLCTGFFVFFIVSMIGARVNLSLSTRHREHTRSGRAGEVVADLLDQYSEIENYLAAGAVGKAHVAIEHFMGILLELKKSDASLSALVDQTRDAVQQLRQASRALSNQVSEEGRAAQSAYTSKAAEVEALLTQLSK